MVCAVRSAQWCVCVCVRVRVRACVTPAASWVGLHRQGSISLDCVCRCADGKTNVSLEGEVGAVSKTRRVDARCCCGWRGRGDLLAQGPAKGKGREMGGAGGGGERGDECACVRSSHTVTGCRLQGRRRGKPKLRFQRRSKPPLLCCAARQGWARRARVRGVQCERACVCVCVACAGGEGGREGGGSHAETDEGGMGQETGSTHSFGWLVGVVVSSSSSNRQLVRTTLPATEPVRRLRRSKLLRMLFVMAVAVFTDGATPGTCVHACEQAQRQCGAALRST